MLNYEEKVYGPLPFFKARMFRYSVFYFPKDPKSRAQVVVEMVESSGKNGNARIYKGDKFKMHLSITEVAAIISRLDFILNNFHFLYSEKNFDTFALVGGVEFEHFPPAKDGVKNKTIFALRIGDRATILNSFKEKGMTISAIATIAMGKKGVSMSVGMSRDELARMREDFKVMYNLLFSLQTAPKDFSKAGEDNEKLAEETNFDFNE